MSSIFSLIFMLPGCAANSSQGDNLPENSTVDPKATLMDAGIDVRDAGLSNRDSSLADDKDVYIADFNCSSKRICGEICCPLGTECVEGKCPQPDLIVSLEDPDFDNYIITRDYFQEDACELLPEEGPCVGGEGWRRLLTFSTLTYNVGEGALYVESPQSSPSLFYRSDCHEHYHMEYLAEYRLLDAAGHIVGLGGKRA